MKQISAPAQKHIVLDDDFASAETEVRIIQATLASHFSVPTDAVDVVTVDDGGILRVRYATVFLTEKDVARIAGQREQQGG